LETESPKDKRNSSIVQLVTFLVKGQKTNRDNRNRPIRNSLTKTKGCLKHLESDSPSYSTFSETLVFLTFAANVRQILRTAARQWVRGPATRYGSRISPVNASGREAFTVDGFNQNSRDFLRKSPVLCGSASS